MCNQSSRGIPSLLVLGVMGTWLFSPLLSQEGVLRAANQGGSSSSLPPVSAQAREPALQERGQEEREPGSKPSSVSSLLAEKAPPSAVAACAKSALEEQGWGVFPYDEQKKQLSAFRVFGAWVLPPVAEMKQPEHKSEWSQARANLNLNFSPAGENRTRIDLSLRLVGERASSLPALRPSNWSSLPSTGKLENEVLAALQAHCGPARKLPLAEHGASRRRNN